MAQCFLFCWCAICLGSLDRAGCGNNGSLQGGWQTGRKIADHVRDARNEIGVRREEMQIATNNSLALICWHDFRFFQDFNSRDFVWLLIGALLALVAVAVIARRRRRWF